MADIVIRDPEAGTNETVNAISWQIRQDFTKTMDSGRAYTFDINLDGVTLDPGTTQVFFVAADGTPRFGGRLREHNELRNGKVELIVDPPEVYAQEAEPTPADEVRENNADSTYITEVATTVPDLYPNTIETVVSASDTPAASGTEANGTIESGLSFIFSNITQARKARKVEYVTYKDTNDLWHTGDLWYGYALDSEGRFPVNYEEMQGEDKTDITLSPGNQNIVGSGPEVTRPPNSNYDAIRIMGAAEGSHQPKYETDNGTENPKWHEPIPAKNYNFQNTIGYLGDQYLDEYQRDYIKVKLDVKGPDVRLGDRFHVLLPTYNVDRELRVISLKENLTEDGIITTVTLSNRNLTAELEQDKQQNNQRGFSSNVQGYAQTFSENVTGAENIGPDSYTLGDVNASDLTNPVMGSVDYPPEVQDELEIELNLRCLPYQAPASGSSAAPAESSGPTNSVVDADDSAWDSATRQFDINMYSGSGDVNDENWTTLYTIKPGSDEVTPSSTTPGGNYPEVLMNQPLVIPDNGTTYVNLSVDNTNTGYLAFRVREEGGSTFRVNGSVVPTNPTNSFTMGPIDTRSNLVVEALHPVDDGSGSDNVEIAGSFYFTDSGSHEHSTPQAGHDPNPGLVYFDGNNSFPVSGDTTPALYPEDVCILVSPTPQPKHNPNDSAFTEVPRENFNFQFGTDNGNQESFAKVNLTDQLTEGYNEVRIGSKTKGRVKASTNGEVYQLILGRR